VHEYDSEFYRFLASFAVRSAEQIVPLLRSALPINSVADFGCGQGAWLSVWRKTGATIMGIDGPYIDRRSLMIDTAHFQTADLSMRIELGRQFDLVQSLEVAEHLPAEKAADVVDTLTRHAPLVMFSAAVPGQGGEHHVNEQPLEYWRSKFWDCGYAAIDWIRPQIFGNSLIQDWYRHNIVLYAQNDHLETLPENLRALRVPENQALCNYWPLLDRIRHAAIRRLPLNTVDMLSRLRTRFELQRRGMRE
jgi:SAM-dependent methyltransferase